jgi:hypothetical protein
MAGRIARSFAVGLALGVAYDLGAVALFFAYLNRRDH